MSATKDETQRTGLAASLALRFTSWAEYWFPDAYIFAALALILVAGAALLIGAKPVAVVGAFGDGFWSFIVFSMQMAFIVITGYVIATSAPAARLINWLASLPRSGPGAVAFIAFISMGTSFLNWGLSLVFSGLLARAMAARGDLRMDYRAAGAAGYLGLGATWALGLTSSAAQLQANPASLPKPLLAITGVLPFTQTIFLWQSMTMAVVLVVFSVLICRFSTPVGEKAVTAEQLGIEPGLAVPVLPPRTRPGEWLEYSPLITILVVLLAAGWGWQQFAAHGANAIANLNTYNLIFLMAGLLLHWRPKAFLNAVAKAVPATTGVLIQFPLYGAIAAIMTTAKGAGGHSLAELIAHGFVAATSTGSFPVVMGAYSAILGFFVPSGGGKWIIEAPYVMKAAADLKVHLGWAVQVYNAAEALPNLINPFWMLPLLGVLSLKARDIVGFTFLQLIVHVPLVLFMLWLFAQTLTFVPPVMP